MSLTMFQACVPVVSQLLSGLSTVVDKTAAHCAEKKYDEAALLTDRLFPDMFTLARQIRQATDFGRNAPARLAGVASPDFAATDDASFAAAKARIEKSLDFVKSFTPAQLDGTEDKDIVWMAGGNQRSMKGLPYLLHFCQPNFYFHVTTAYNIIRHNGVEVGKRDYLGTY